MSNSEYKNIVCISNTTIYTLPEEWKAHNLEFYIFSPIDNETLNLDCINYNDDITKISLLHEMVSGS